MKLYKLAHSRAGDKGNVSNISVIAYKSEDYNHIKKYVTVEKVKEHFKGIVNGSVTRYEFAQLGALNFVMSEALGGGVTRSLRLDIHGKALSGVMLDMEIPDIS